MTAAKTNNDSNKIFYKGESRLFHADSVTNNTTGVTVEISNSLEKLYNYMLNQYLYRQSHGQRFAESKERLGTIARIGDPKKNTKAQIDNLIALGLVEIIGKVARCDVYRVNLVDNEEKNLTFTYKSVNGEPTYDHSARIGSAREGNFVAADTTSEEKQDDGKSDEEAATTQAEQAATTATPSTDTPADQNVGMASKPAPASVGQHDRVASDDDSGSDHRTAGYHKMSHEQKKDPFPWRGDTLIKGRLSENAYQWAITMGATNWRHACELVWERVGGLPPDAINENRKPLSLCEEQ